MQHSLNNMIRLAKFQLDEKKAKLSQLNEVVDTIKSNMQQIDKDIEAEGINASGDMELSSTFPAWVQAARARKETMEESLCSLQEEIELVNDEMMELFSELKRYELTLGTIDSKTKRKHAKRDEKQLDEMAVQRFRSSGG